MKVTVTNLFVLIFLLTPVSAFNFSFLSPPEAELNSSFTVSLYAESDGNSYDFRGYVFDDSKAYSEMFNGSSWVSPSRYLISRFPPQSEFQLVSHVLGKNDLCVKLRKTNTDKVYTLCNKITITPMTVQEESQENSPNLPQYFPPEAEPLVEEEPEEELKPIQKRVPSFIPLQSENISIEADRIMLSPPQKSALFETSEGKIRRFLAYSFTGLLVILVILLAWRKL